jgi:Tetratricopeptide repeat
MRLAIVSGCLICLLCQVATASPPRPHRKPASDQYAVDAAAAFVDGLLADQDGNLGEAEKGYEAANKISPQANTFYNLADVQQRMGRLKQAIESYKQYLVLAPDAKDHADVALWIEEMERSEGTIVIDGEEPDGMVLIEGRLLGPSPAITHLPKGFYTATRITPTDFQRREFNVNNATTTHVEFGRGSSRGKPGNVVIVNNRSGISGSWTDHGVTVRMNDRQTLPSGHYEGTMRSASLCSPIIFDVPPGDDVTYVYVDMALPTEQPGRNMACSAIVVKQLKVHFP